MIQTVRYQGFSSTKQNLTSSKPSTYILSPNICGKMNAIDSVLSSLYTDSKDKLLYRKNIYSIQKADDIK